MTTTGGYGAVAFVVPTSAVTVGLSVVASTGQVTYAIPAITSPGTTLSFTIQGTDSLNGVAQKQCTITVYATITVACPALLMAPVGVPLSTPVISSGGKAPLRLSIIHGSIRPLILNAVSISGTPITIGVLSFTLEATDANGHFSDSGACQIQVTLPQCPVVTGMFGIGCPSGIAEAALPYRSAIPTFGGVPPFSFAITQGALPDSFVLNAITGVIAGTDSNDVLTQLQTFRERI
jgi:hypothetical protein